MLIETVIGGLIVLAWQRSGKRGVLTPERESCYVNAMEHLTDTDKLRKLAEKYEQEGLPIQAKMLRKRAELRDLRNTNPELAQARHDAFVKGMKSVNIQAILQLANEFEKLTASGSAKALRERAQMLRDKQLRGEPLEEKKEEVKQETKSDDKSDTIPVQKMNGAAHAE